MCNQRFGKDDDYARLIFTSAEGAISSPARNELKAKVQRFADRRESKRALESIYKTLRTAYLPNKSGVFVKRHAFIMDGNRIDAFAIRVTKALFYREKGHRLPDGYTVTAIYHRRMEEALRHGRDADFFLFFISIIDELNNNPLRSWGDTFAYSWVQSPNGSEQTWWMLHFYGNPLFLCWTREKGQGE
jgi:hypothetical protein